MRLARFIARLAGFRSEQGTATVEFVLTAPAVIFTFIAALESGIFMVRYILLDRALDMTVRELRLGLIETPALADLKSSICDNTGLVSDCRNNLQIEMFSVNTATWVLPQRGANCRDRAEQINIDEPNLGVENEVMMIRACLTADALFPTTSIAARMNLDSQNGYYISSTSAFVNEP